MSSPEDRDKALRSTQARLAALQQQKAAREAGYLKARKYIEMPEWQERRDEAIGRIARVVNRTNQKGMDSTQAVLALGQIIQVLDPLGDVLRPIVEFESIQRSLGELGKLEEGLKG